jgi:hypothetical protein
MIRLNTLAINETLEVLDNLPLEEQEAVLKEYLAMSAAASRFLQWYINCDLSDVAADVSYEPAINYWTTISKNLVLLEGLARSPRDVKIKTLERLLSNISPDEMMFMENVLTRDLKNYYPNIAWDMVAKYFPGI